MTGTSARAISPTRRSSVNILFRHSRESGSPGGPGDLPVVSMDSRFRGNDGEWLERDIVVLLPGILELLVPELAQSQRDPSPRRMGHDHVVDEALAGRDER